MAYSHLYPYPNFSPTPQQLKTITGTSVIYVSTNGSDANGDGSLANPFASLSRAMNFAREYTIFGNAILYIRFLRGEYNISENVDLYHPQGGNIVIEGDPSEFKQRVLWQVQDYTWNISNFAGGGHTGTIRLFDGITSGTGVTIHGFTGQDQGTYFSLTNAAIGSRDGYYSLGATIGINSGTTSSYNYLFHGDRFYNHGLSYEEGEGILGIGRILGSTANQYTLNVQFQNVNFDSRCPMWQINAGGLSNTVTWAGTSNNYPETQYSQPNGYYGSENWKNDSGSVLYPTKALAVQNSGAVNISTITTDPYILSTYPVVFRADYTSNVGTIFLKNGCIRAIRNIFFANSQSPFTVNGVTGATLNWSQALSAISDQAIPTCANGTALYFENAVVGIRHIGFYGTGTAIAASGSRLYAYYDQTGYTGSAPIPSQNGMTRYAIQGDLDNSPVICTTQCKNGIVAKNCDINFSSSSGLSRTYGLDYRHNGSYISTTGRSVELISSKLVANSMHLDCNTDIPKFIATVVVPYFPGTTYSGISASFAGFTASSFWSTFPRAQVYLQKSASSEVSLGYVNYIVDAGSIGSVASGDTTNPFAGATTSGGIPSPSIKITTTSTTTTVSGTHYNPTDYRKFVLYGVKSAAAGTTFIDGLRYVTTKDVVAGGITAAFNGGRPLGGTLSIRFFKNNSASGVSASYTIGMSTIALQGFNGVTVAWTDMRNNAAGSSAAPLFVSEFVSFGGNDSRVYMNSSGNALFAADRSSVLVEKSLNITNGGFCPVDVRDNSSINIGDCITNETNGNASPMNFQTRNTTLGSLSVRGFSKSAFRLSNGSDGRVGVIFAKHPLHGNPEFVNSTNAHIHTLHAQNNSRLTVGSAYAMGIYGRATVFSALFVSHTGISYGFYNLSGQGFIRSDASRIVFLGGSGGAGESVFSFDGGTADLRHQTSKGNSSTRFSVPVVYSGGEIIFGSGCVLGAGTSVTSGGGGNSNDGIQPA